MNAAIFFRGATCAVVVDDLIDVGGLKQAVRLIQRVVANADDLRQSPDALTIDLIEDAIVHDFALDLWPAPSDAVLHSAFAAISRFADDEDGDDESDSKLWTAERWRSWRRTVLEEVEAVARDENGAAARIAPPGSLGTFVVEQDGRFVVVGGVKTIDFETGFSRDELREMRTDEVGVWSAGRPGFGYGTESGSSGSAWVVESAASPSRQIAWNHVFFGISVIITALVVALVMTLVGCGRVADRTSMVYDHDSRSRVGSVFGDAPRHDGRVRRFSVEDRRHFGFGVTPRASGPGAWR